MTDHSLVADGLLARANAGDVDAQYTLGHLQCEDAHPEESPAGELWLRKAASAGHARAQFELGDYYRVQHPDTKEAITWLTLAANHGVAEACAEIGEIYYFGDGIPKNEHAAVSWFQRGVDAGEPLAQYRLAYAHARGLGGMARNEQIALDLYLKSAEQGNQDAQLKIGWAYLEGTYGLGIDLRKAAEWFKKAADQEEPEAQAELGWLYLRGEEKKSGIAADYTRARRLFEAAVDSGEPVPLAFWGLGRLYREGKGVRRNNRKALYFLHIANQLIDYPEEELEKECAAIAARVPRSIREQGMFEADREADGRSPFTDA
jgi:uncharacterized protein